jgi:hypothetical protein
MALARGEDGLTKENENEERERGTRTISKALGWRWPGEDGLTNENENENEERERFLRGWDGAGRVKTG